MVTFDDDGLHYRRYSNVIFALEHVKVAVFAVNWTMYSYVNRFVFVAFLLMAYAHQPYRMHNLYLLNNPSTLNLELVYPVNNDMD